MSGWYYQDEHEETIGVLSDDEIQRLAERGGLKLETPVSHAERTDGRWVPASRIVGLERRIQNALQAQQPEAAPATPVRKAYVPPKPTWKERLAHVRQRLERTGQRIVTAAAALTDRQASPPRVHVCAECNSEFTKFESPGRCPVCGEWERMTCDVCGFRARAKAFVEKQDKCPRCAADAVISGRQQSRSPTPRIIFLILLLAAVGLAIWALL